MLRSYRRVVTGHDINGKSVVLSDSGIPEVYEPTVRPGMGTTGVWSTQAVPADNTILPKNITMFPDMAGVSFMIMEFPPEADLGRMTPEQRIKATEPLARLAPQTMEIDTTRHYGMHATDTLDILIVLKGEITLLLDSGDIALKPHDTVIQRGTNHAWVNYSSEPALVAAAVIDAKALPRSKVQPARD